MSSDYTSVPRTFDIKVDISALASGVPVSDVSAQPEYPTQQNATFDGLVYFPGLPKINFSVTFRFLEGSGQEVASDGQLGTIYNGLEFGEHKVDAAYTEVEYTLENIGDQEGIQALDVTSQFTYVGTRDSNCT